MVQIQVRRITGRKIVRDSRTEQKIAVPRQDSLATDRRIVRASRTPRKIVVLHLRQDSPIIDRRTVRVSQTILVRITGTFLDLAVQ